MSMYTDFHRCSSCDRNTHRLRRQFYYIVYLLILLLLLDVIVQGCSSAQCLRYRWHKHTSVGQCADSLSDIVVCLRQRCCRRQYLTLTQWPVPARVNWRGSCFEVSRHPMNRLTFISRWLVRQTSQRFDSNIWWVLRLIGSQVVGLTICWAHSTYCK